jgi:hypothetical protein
MLEIKYKDMPLGLKVPDPACPLQGPASSRLDLEEEAPPVIYILPF